MSDFPFVVYKNLNIEYSFDSTKELVVYLTNSALLSETRRP